MYVLFFFKSFVSFGLCIALSGCIETEDPVSGPELVQVNSIPFMKAGGRLYEISDSGAVSKSAAFLFRANLDNTIQLVSWNKQKGEWGNGVTIISYPVPSRTYFIGRIAAGDDYYYFAFRFIGDTYVQSISAIKPSSAIGTRPISGLTYSSLIQIFDDLTKDKSHVFHGNEYGPKITTYLIESLEAESINNTSSSPASQSQSSVSRGSSSEETRSSGEDINLRDGGRAASNQIATLPECGDPGVLNNLIGYERDQIREAISDPSTQMDAMISNIFGMGADLKALLDGKIRIYGVRTLNLNSKLGRSECRARVTLDLPRSFMGKNSITEDIDYVLELTDTPGEYLISDISGGL